MKIDDPKMGAILIQYGQKTAILTHFGIGIILTY